MREDEIFNQVIEYTSKNLRSSLERIPSMYKKDIEEIRLRINSPLSIYHRKTDYFVKKNGNLSLNPWEGLLVDGEELSKTFQLVTNYSIYSVEDEVKNGFITLRGGHRVGIGGKVIFGRNGIEGIKNISSLNFRIGREKRGISLEILEYLIDCEGNFLNTLIISPPQCGKTTLLRDLVKNLSDGVKDRKISGFKVGLVDERSEIAGVYNGVPQKSVGIRTDILDSCHKSLGIIMLIRSMSPQIIAVDEIGRSEDVLAIQEALRAGINLIATIHGFSLDDIKERSSMADLFRDKVFKRYIVLDNSLGVGTIKELIDGQTNENLINEKRKLNAVS